MASDGWLVGCGFLGCGCAIGCPCAAGRQRDVAVCLVAGGLDQRLRECGDADNENLLHDVVPFRGGG